MEEAKVLQLFIAHLSQLWSQSGGACRRRPYTKRVSQSIFAVLLDAGSPRCDVSTAAYEIRPSRFCAFSTWPSLWGRGQATPMVSSALFWATNWFLLRLHATFVLIWFRPVCSSGAFVGGLQRGLGQTFGSGGCPGKTVVSSGRDGLRN